MNTFMFLNFWSKNNLFFFSKKAEKIRVEIFSSPSKGPGWLRPLVAKISRCERYVISRCYISRDVSPPL